MTTKKEILKNLYRNDVLFIIIGGIALRMYNSPRVTHDIDLAIRTLDVDKVIGIMYKNNYYLIEKVFPDNALVALYPEDAAGWVENSKAGSMTFITLKKQPKNATVPLSDIDITTQIDLLFELSVPIIKMKQRAWETTIDNVKILIASKEDLLVLKQNRKDKSPADYADIAFLENLIKEDQSL